MMSRLFCHSGYLAYIFLLVSERSQQMEEAEIRVWAGWICSETTFLEVHFHVAAASTLLS